MYVIRDLWLPERYGARGNANQWSEFVIFYFTLHCTHECIGSQFSRVSALSIADDVLLAVIEELFYYKEGCDGFPE